MQQLIAMLHDKTGKTINFKIDPLPEDSEADEDTIESLPETKKINPKKPVDRKITIESMFVDESDKEFRLPGNQELDAIDRNRRRMTFAARPKNASSYEEEQTTKNKYGAGSLRDIAS